MEETGKIKKNDSKITFETLWRVTLYRKKWTIIVYLVLLIATIIITLCVLHKKYISEAIIIVDKTSSTNLADINPYVLEKLTGMSSKTGGGLASILSSMSVGQTRELDIIKSPLVLDKVIRENDIRYDKSAGKKADKLMTTEDFLKIGGVEFENRKDSNLIKIKYKSKSPQKAYEVVKSIIKTYGAVSEKINTKKASTDKAFLKEEVAKTEKEIYKISAEIKDYKIKEKVIDPELDIKLLTATSNINPYRKDVAEKLANFPEIEQTITELKLKLKAVVSKYAMLKEKYEWSFLVEQMSKNATNVVVLKEPEIRESWDKAEPKLSINIILSLVVSTFATIFLALYFEFNDSKLAFMTTNPSKTFWIDKKTKESYLFDSTLSLKESLNELNAKTTNIINFGLNEEDFKYFQTCYSNFLNSLTESKTYFIDEKSNPIEIFDLIESSPSVLFVGQIGKSSKEIFCKTEEIANNKNNLLAKIVLFEANLLTF